MDGAARKAAEGKEGRPRGRQEKRRRVLDPPTSARRANPLTGRGPATRGRPRGWSSGRADEAPQDIGTRDGGSPVLVARRNGRLRRLRAGPAPFGRHPIGTAANFKPCPSRRGVSNGEGWDTYAGRRRVGGRGTLPSAGGGREGCEAGKERGIPSPEPDEPEPGTLPPRGDRAADSQPSTAEKGALHAGPCTGLSRGGGGGGPWGWEDGWRSRACPRRDQQRGGRAAGGEEGGRGSQRRLDTDAGGRRARERGALHAGLCTGLS